MEKTKERLLSATEGYISVILSELGEDDYNKYIEGNHVLKEYDELMKGYKDDKLSYKKIKKVYQEVKEKVKAL